MTRDTEPDGWPYGQEEAAERLRETASGQDRELLERLHDALLQVGR
ncbi:hypothetical protein [Nocardia sp. NPDC057440]